MGLNRGILLAATTLLFAAVLLPEVAAMRYIVGAKTGWSQGATNFTTWAQDIKFYNGDWLFFVYDRDQANVLEVNKTDYESCNSDLPLHNWTTGAGRVVVPLNVTKTFYFISGKGMCYRGMKVAIHVLKAPPPPSASPENSSSPPSASPENSSSPPSASPVKSSSPPSASPENSSSPPSASPVKSSSPPSASPEKSSSPPSASPENSSSPPSASPVKSSSPPSASPENSSSPPSASPVKSSSPPSASPEKSSSPPSASPIKSSSPPSFPATFRSHVIVPALFAIAAVWDSLPLLL